MSNTLCRDIAAGAQSLLAFAAWVVLSGLTMLPPAALAMMILISPASAQAGDAQDDITSLERQASALSRDGKFAEAAVFAERALELAERRFGPQDPALAQALSNLAYLYLKLNRYGDAEILYGRAVAIYEAAGHHEGALWSVLQRLAEADRALGRTAEADALLTRVRAIEQMMSAPFQTEIPEQEIITTDLKRLRVRSCGAIRFQVDDPHMLLFNFESIENVQRYTILEIGAALRRIIGNRSATQIFAEAGAVAEETKRALDQDMRQFGYSVHDMPANFPACLHVI